MPGVLRGADGPAGPSSGRVLPDADGGIPGGDRLRAGHRVAVQGLDLAAGVSGLRSGEDAAGAFHAVEDAQAAEPGGPRGGVRLGAGTAAGVGIAARQDRGGGFDDAGGERGDARDRAEGRRDGVRRVARAAGAGIGDRDADAAGPCEAGPQAPEEGVEQGLEAPARPGGADHEDEGRPHAPGAQARGGGGHGDRRGGRGDGADDGRRRHRLAAGDAGRDGAAVGGRWERSRRKWWATRATTRTRP